MRHFHDVDEMAAALAIEAEKLGQEVQRREDGLFMIFKTDCECGASSVTEVNLTNVATTIWETLSWA